MIRSLLTERRFAPLFWCQFFAAFNDNFLKNALLFLILWGAGHAAAAGGEPPPPGAPAFPPARPLRPAPKSPSATVVAVTLSEVSVPNTATRSPTFTSARLAEETPRSRYVVAELTSTVTTVPDRVVTVKLSVPTDFTVPMAVGCAPLRGARPEWVDEPLGAFGGVEVAAPATAPPPMARPRAMMAAAVTCTPRRRIPLIDSRGSGAMPFISALSSCMSCSFVVVC